MIRSIIVNIDPTSISPLGLIITRTFGFKTNPRDPHNKYEDNCNASKRKLNKNDLHGKKMFYPKYGNSFYEALEYDRKLENSGNYDPAKKTKQQTEKTKQNSKAQPQKEELKTTQSFTKPHDKHVQFVKNSTVDTKNDLLYLLPP